MNEQHTPPAGRAPVEHELKTWSAYFAAVHSGAKTFELRRHDRDFQVGDVLILRETDQLSGAPSGRECRRVITYKLEKFHGGLPEGWCVLGIQVEREIIPTKQELQLLRLLRSDLVSSLEFGQFTIRRRKGRR